MSVEYLDLADFIAIAQAVTGLDLRTVLNVTNVDLADSALHAPAAGFGEDDFYPEFVDKAAVLAVAAGDWDEAATAAWLRTHLRFADDGEVG